MCGIFGFSDSSRNVEYYRIQLNEGLHSLTHRGPDGYGEYYWQHVYFGHRRLSIIDLSDAAAQPFHAFDRKVSIVFNGEIYNYKELAATMPSMLTSSDTEVILSGYYYYGVEFFKRLRGIFAFSIYDFREGERIILYRDLAGVKPLYYIHRGTQFAFASEIKALKKLFSLEPNEAILKTYLSIGYCLEPETALKSVLCCRPGECITFDVHTGILQSTQLSGYQFGIVNSSSFDENLERTEQLLQQAVNRNMVADVPISISLSGGIDSSLVASFASYDAKLFTVQMPDSDYDESQNAKDYADFLDRTIEIVELREESGLELLDRILLHFDQPYSDTSSVPFYFMTKAAANYGKVLVGGDGGDEIHCGYKSFGWLPLVWQSRSLIRGMHPVLSGLLSGSKKRSWNRIYEISRNSKMSGLICEWSSWLPPSLSYDGKSVFQFDVQTIFEKFRDEWLAEEIAASSQLTYAYFMKRMLGDYLRKADMMSMLNGLEYRVPMLDEDLVNYSLTIPFHQKANLIRQKRILRELHNKKYSGLGSNRPKSGFSIPMDRWLSKADFEIIKESLTKRNALVTEYISSDYINFLFSALDGRQSEIVSRSSVYQRIVQLYAFQLFCEQI